MSHDTWANIVLPIGITAAGVLYALYARWAYERSRRDRR